MTNTASEPLRLGGAVTAGGMTYVLTKTTIEPGATYVFDADKVKNDAIPDVNGHTIPKDAVYGKLHWIELSNGKKAGLLGCTSLASVKNRRKSSFSCGSTCDANFYGHPYFIPGIFTSLPVGGGQVSQITEFTQTRFAQYSTPIDYQGIMNIFYIDNPNVVSMGPDGSTATNLVETGKNVGSTNLNYTENDAHFAYDPGGQVCNEADSFISQSGTASTYTCPSIARETLHKFCDSGLIV